MLETEEDVETFLWSILQGYDRPLEQFRHNEYSNKLRYIRNVLRDHVDEDIYDLYCNGVSMDGGACVRRVPLGSKRCDYHISNSFK